MGEAHHCALPEDEVPTPRPSPPSAPTLDHVVWRLAEDAVHRRRAQRLKVELRDDGALHLVDDGSEIDWDMDISSVVDVVMSPTATGTRVSCLPRAGVRASHAFDFEHVGRRLQELAFLHPGVSIELHDDQSTPESETEDEVVSDVGEPTVTTRPRCRRRTFCYDSGVPGFVRHINRTRSLLHPNVIHLSGESDGVCVEIALQWNAGYTEHVYGFVNAVRDDGDGPGSDGLYAVLIDAIFDHARRRRRMLPALLYDDLGEGLTAVIVATGEGAVLDDRVAEAVEVVCRRELTEWFAAHPDEGDLIVEKACAAFASRRMSRRSCGFGTRPLH